MGCLLVLLALISARLVLILMWIFSNYVDRAFDGFVAPLLGLIFLPWTTLMYVLLWSPGGVHGFEWFLVGFGFVIDLGSYARGQMERSARYA